MSAPKRAPRRLSSPPTRAGAKAFETDHNHALVEPGIERNQHARNRSGQGGKAPGERVDGMQVYPALCGEEPILTGCPHAHAPAAEPQEDAKRDP